MLIRFRDYINRRTLISIRNILSSLHNTLFSLLPTMTTTQSSSDPPPPFDPIQPSFPVSFPIKTLKDLESRSYFDSFHYPFNKSSVTLESNDDNSLPMRPRILVCHDLAGGYTDDKWVQGGTNAEAYAIWHWYLIDVFVYFSHSLVTLPPPCWTNTAHKHGVQILGTFITEWDEGKVIANTLLKTKESAHMYAERLTELAVALGFDGWLIDYPKLSAAVAGSRKFDVYMGIDVFGRGTYGGGQWTTNVALDVLKKDDVSAAIFAPGWIYETKQPPDFQTAQNRWWGLVEKSWGISQNYPKVLPFYSNFDKGHGYHFSVDGGQVSNAPWNNISCQSFQPFLEYLGDPSPNTIHVSIDFKEASYSGGGNITFKGSLEDNAYFTTRLFQGEMLLGNLPVHFTYSVKSDGSSMVGLSLEFDSSMLERTSVLLASWGNTLLTMKQLSSKFSNVIMPRRVTKLEAAPGWVIQESSIAMNGYKLTGIYVVCYKSKPDVYKPKLESGSLDLDTVARGPSEYYAVLGHIGVETSSENSDFPPSAAWLVEGQCIKWTSDSQSKTLSVKIIWKLKDGMASRFPKYNIYVEKEGNRTVEKPSGVLEERQEYLGVAQVEAFYVSDLVVLSGSSSLNFIIQVCRPDGTSQKLVDSPSFRLPVGGT